MRGCDKNHFPKLIKAHTRILRIETFSPIISFSEIRNSLARWQIHDDEESDSLFIVFGKLTHSEEIFSPKVITHTLLTHFKFFFTLYVYYCILYSYSYRPCNVYFLIFSREFWLEFFLMLGFEILGFE